MTAGIVGLVLFFIPGWLLIPTDRKHDYPERIFLVAGLSAAIWIPAFWYLSVVPIPFAWLLALMTAAGGIALIRHKRIPVRRSVRSWIVPFAYLSAVTVPVVILLWGLPVPPGKDMSMHAYIARAILEHGGFPDSLLPAVPVANFGTYPFGFSVITAVLSRLGGLAVAEASLIAVAVSHILFDVSLYMVLRKRFTPAVSGMVAISITWTSQSPHMFASWGANPTVLAMAFLLFAVSEHTGHPAPRHAFRTLTFLSASLLTNPMPIVASVFVLAMLLPVRRRHMRQAVRAYLSTPVLTYALLAVLPYAVRLMRFPWHMTPDTERFVRGLQQAELSGWNGSVAGFLSAFAGLTAGSFDSAMLAVYAAALIYAATRDGNRLLPHLVAWIVIALLVFNSRIWMLPFSSVLYPVRIIPVLVIPIAVGIADAVSDLTARSRIAGAILLLFLAVLLVQRNIAVRFVRYSRTQSAVTHSDMAAMEWLAAHTDKRDIIANDYDDAGLWIPALAWRPVTVYQTNPADYHTVRTYISPVPSYAYVGASHVTSLETLTAPFGRVASESAMPVYVKDGVTVYRLDRSP